MGILEENFENFKQSNKEHSGGNFQNTKQSAIRGKLYEKFSKYPAECNNGYIGGIFIKLSQSAIMDIFEENFENFKKRAITFWGKFSKCQKK